MTKKIKTVVYGEGGFDESKPENNVVEIVYYTKDELDVIAAGSGAAIRTGDKPRGSRRASRTWNI